ncbi:hypothetical protein DRQ36_08925 [bacterium]|nr:MAG: hypothetical protein DRQ36_08925 [bacterium]
MPIDKSKYLKLFFSEADELVTQLGREMVALETDLGNYEVINKIFRITHTIKGNSAAVGFDIISSFAHRIEDVFDKVRNRELDFSRETANVMFDALRLLEDILAEVKKTGKEPSGLPEIADILEKIAKGRTDWLDSYEKTETEERITVSDSVRVPMKQLDDMINLIGEILIGISRLETVNQYLEDNQLKETTIGLRRAVSDLQYALMNIRLVPLAYIFDQFPRLIRDLAEEENKQISLTITGDDIQVDSKVVEKIKSPLIHILRNAVSHGIEKPAERKKAKKPEKGNVAIVASRQRNRVEISVNDDGQGIDPKIIAPTAKSLGIVTDGWLEEATENEIIELIFEPGFTTAKKATEVSGRGVGMDVVRAELSSIGGIVQLYSKPGIETKVTLDIPVSIATIKTLLCEVNERAYAIPINVIDAIQYIKPEDIRSVNGEDNFAFRDELTPILYLRTLLFSLEPEITETEEIEVVVVDYAGKHVGLAVDRLIREEEIVVKPIEVLSDVRAVSGASILGDGSVVLILDVNELMKRASTRKVETDGH